MKSPSKRFTAFLATFVLLALGPVAAQAALYQAITIPASNVSGDLTDYPVYVDLSSLDQQFRDQATAGDISVEPAGGGAALPHELVSLDSTGGELHFLAPNVSSTTDTSYEIHWGAGHVGPGNSTAVWGNYAGVWHLQDAVGDPQGAADSTANGNNSTTAQGIVDAGAVGIMGNAFDTSTSKISRMDIGVGTNMNPASLTIEMWTNFTTDLELFPTFNRDWGFYRRAQSGFGGGPGWFDLIASLTNGGPGTSLPPGTVYFQFDDGGCCGVVKSTTLVDDGEWHHLLATINDDTDEAKLYIDGVEEDSTTASSWTPATTTDLDNGFFNQSAGDGSSFAPDGRSDEIRYRAGVLSGAEVAAQYLNQRHPGEFYLVGPVVPEPSTMILAAMGAAVLLGSAARRGLGKPAP